MTLPCNWIAPFWRLASLAIGTVILAPVFVEFHFDAKTVPPVVTKAPTVNGDGNVWSMRSVVAL